MELKTCTKCFIEKELSAFGASHYRNKKSLRGVCRPCYNAQIKPAAAARRKANSEQNKIYYRKYRAENKDKFLTYRKEAKEKNPFRKAELQRKRHSLKQGNHHEPYTDKQVLELYGSDCHLCRKPIDLSAPRKTGIKGWELGLHMDHVIPLSMQGPDTIENIRPAHGFCNLSKRDRV